MSRLLTSPKMLSKMNLEKTAMGNAPPDITRDPDVANPQVGWAQGVRQLMSGDRSLISRGPRAHSDHKTEPGPKHDSKWSVREANLWTNAPKGSALAKAPATFTPSDTPPAVTIDNDTQWTTDIDFHLQPTDDDSIVNLMPEFAHIQHIGIDNEKYMAVRDARLTVQKRNVEKLANYYHQAEKDVSYGRDIIRNTELRMHALTQLVEMAVVPGNDQILQNFYAQEKLLHLLELDIRNPVGKILNEKHTLQNYALGMKLGIGFGLWHFSTDAAGVLSPVVVNASHLPGAGLGELNRNERSQSLTVRRWMQSKCLSFQQEAEISAAALSKSIVKFNEQRVAAEGPQPAPADAGKFAKIKKQLQRKLHRRGSKLSNADKKEGARMKQELRKYLRAVYGEDLIPLPAAKGVSVYCDADFVVDIADERHRYKPSKQTLNDPSTRWACYLVACLGPSETASDKDKDKDKVSVPKSHAVWQFLYGQEGVLLQGRVQRGFAGPYYGRLAYASGLVISGDQFNTQYQMNIAGEGKSTDIPVGEPNRQVGDAEDANQAFRNREAFRLNLLGGEKAKNKDSHLPERSPHLQLLMAKALMSGEAVRKGGSHVYQVGGNLVGTREEMFDSSRHVMNGHYSLAEDHLQQFQRWNSAPRRNDGTAFDSYTSPPDALNQIERSAVDILLEHASKGAIIPQAGGDHREVSPGLVEAKSLRGRLNLGQSVAEELRSELPEPVVAPSKNSAGRRALKNIVKSYGDPGWIDADIKRCLRGRYNNAENRHAMRREALQDLYDAACAGDCKAMASLIELNMVGSKKLGIERDLFETIRLIQDGISQGMMYEPHFRAHMQFLGEKNGSFFYFQGTSAVADLGSEVSRRVHYTRSESWWGRWNDSLHFSNHSTYHIRNFLFRAIWRRRGDKNTASARAATLRGLFGFEGKKLKPAEVAACYNAEPERIEDGKQWEANPMDQTVKAEQEKYRKDLTVQRGEMYDRALASYHESIEDIRLQTAYFPKRFPKNVVAEEIADEIGKRMFDENGMRRKDIGDRMFLRYNELGKYLLPELNQLQTKEDMRRVRDASFQRIKEMGQGSKLSEDVHLMKQEKLLNMYECLSGVYEDDIPKDDTPHRKEAKRKLVMESLEKKRECLEKRLLNNVNWSVLTMREETRTAIVVPAGKPVPAPRTLVGNLRSAVVPPVDTRMLSSQVSNKRLGMEVREDQQLVVEYYPFGRPAALQGKSSGCTSLEIGVPLGAAHMFAKQLNLHGDPSPDCFVAYLQKNGGTDRVGYLDVQPKDKASACLKAADAFARASGAEREQHIKEIEAKLRGDAQASASSYITAEQIYVYLCYLLAHPDATGPAPVDEGAKSGKRFRIIRNLNFALAYLAGACGDESTGAHLYVLKNRGDSHELNVDHLQTDANRLQVLTNMAAKWEGTDKEWQDCVQLAAGRAAEAIPTMLRNRHDTTPVNTLIPSASLDGSMTQEDLSKLMAQLQPPKLETLTGKT